MDKISVYGSTGFIGSRFTEMFFDNVIRIPRGQDAPMSSNILYLISTTDNYNVYKDLHIDIDTNLNKLMYVLETIKDRNIVFNFVSSWFVYGDVDLPAYEDDYCNPKGFYSITKRAAEQLLISYCETFGINYRIFRLANVIGPFDHGVSTKKNALQYLIEEIRNDRDIYLYHGGNFVRDYIYVDDVCRGISTCMSKGKLNEIYNIGSGVPYNFRSLMEYCAGELHSTSRFLYTEPSEFHKLVQVKDMYLEVSKIKELGFKRRFNIYSALDKILW